MTGCWIRYTADRDGRIVLAADMAANSALSAARKPISSSRRASPGYSDARIGRWPTLARACAGRRGGAGVRRVSFMIATVFVAKTGGKRSRSPEGPAQRAWPGGLRGGWDGRGRRDHARHPPAGPRPPPTGGTTPASPAVSAASNWAHREASPAGAPHGRPGLYKMPRVRELTSDDLGLLLSVFAVLLIAFGVDFHFSRKDVRRHHPAALVFAVVSLAGELATALVLVLTWVALWSPAAWERIDDLLVLVPGSIAVLCAVTLTIETVTSHATEVWRSATPGRHAGCVDPSRSADTPE
jgi:hypothetical protein